MYEETLKQRISKLGPDHPRTLVSRHNLAMAYWAADRPVEAIAILEKMLPGREECSRAGAPQYAHVYQ